MFAIVLADKSPHATTAVVADSIFRDRWAAVAQVLIAGCGVVAVLISYGERWRAEHVAEYYALLAAAGAGMAFFVQASNLMTLFLGLEWFSISLYILCAIDIDLVGSLEAGLKYLIIGAVGSATLLFGSALVYGATGQLELRQDRRRRPLARLAARARARDDRSPGSRSRPRRRRSTCGRPTPTQGAPTPVTAFMASATKVAALVVTYRLLLTAFPDERAPLDVGDRRHRLASLAIGNIAALVQRNVKRLLAYSSVSHAGFMLIPIAAANALGGRALLYYLIPYCAMSLGAFAVIAARERELGAPVTLDNLAGFGWERPFLGVAMAVFMFGFLGFPLTGGFIGKFYAFAAAYRHGWWWLIVVGVDRDDRLGRVLPRRRARDVPARPASSCSSPRPAAHRRATSRSARRRDLPRRHGRLVLRRAAADRRGPLGRRTRCRSKRWATSGPPSGLRRPVTASPGRSSASRRTCGATATAALIAKTPRQATSDEIARRRHAVDRVRAHLARDDQQHERDAPEQGLERHHRVVAPVEVPAERRDRRDGGEGHSGEESVEREPVPSTRIGKRRHGDEQTREVTPSHGSIASRPGRTVLLVTLRAARWRLSPGSATRPSCSAATGASGSTSTRS